MLRDIAGYVDAMRESTDPKSGVSDFFLQSQYVDVTGRTLPCYDITRKGCEMVANKMTGAKGIQFTAAYINRFHEMEQSGGHQIPRTLPEALRFAAELAEKNTELIAENDKQKQIIGELQPKADYTDYILTSMGVMTATQIAADYGISANRLNKILKAERIQRYIGGQWILYHEHMNKGWTKSETIPITRSDGSPDTRMLTKWTQKGRLMINEVLNRRGTFANMDLVQEKVTA